MDKQELRKRMAALPEPPNDSHPPLWDYWRHDLWQRIVNGEDPDGFMGWPCVYHTMLQNHWLDVVSKEAVEMALRPGGGGVYPASPLAPAEFYPQDRLVHEIPHSANLLHQMYHLWSWEQVTDRKVKHLNSVVEFGGGYGAMALVARRMGFGGIYEIVDLPEFLLLQHYFITNVGGDADDRTYIFTNTNTRHIAKSEHSLAIAGYSLSETDYARRNEFFAENIADSYLLWYSNRFVDYDNIEYFQHRLPSMLPDMEWRHWRVTHMPPETWYSVGWKPL